MSAQKVSYRVSGWVNLAHDAAIVLEGEDPLATLIESVIQATAIDIEVTCGDVTMHLAAWMDPEHWSDDWAEKGINPNDVAELVAAQLVSM